MVNYKYYKESYSYAHIYQDELLHEIDYLLSTLGHRPNQVNRCLVRLIHDLEKL